MKLSDKLSLYEVIVSFGIFIAIAVIVELYAVKNESRQAEDITRLLQSELVGTIDTRLYSVEQNVRRSVKELQKETTEEIKSSASESLGILVDSDSIISGCGIVMVPERMSQGKEWMEYMRHEGDGVHTMQLGDTDYRYTRQQWYTAALDSNSGIWSEPYFDEGAGDCLMVTFACPVRNEAGEIFCVVTADVAVSYLDEQLNRLIPYPESYAFILTKQGKFLEGYPMSPYREEDRGKSKRLNLPAISKSLQEGETSIFLGRDFICTFTPVENINLVLCTASPLTSVTQVTSRIRLPLLIILVLGFAILIFLLRATLRRALRPLNGLTDAATRIGSGDFDTSIPPAPEYSDLDNLSRAMTDMRDSINRYIVQIEESTRAREHMETQLRIARDIQRSLLPPGDASFKREGTLLSLAAYQESAMEVGGDLYDYVESAGRLYFIIADVSGKGIPAALMTSYVKSLFHFAAQQAMAPADIVTRINDNMCADNSTNMFVTMLVGYIDAVSNTMVMANAGHNPAVVCSGDGCRYLDLPAGLPAGVMPGMPYSETACPFAPGDTLFLYTDGMSEAESPQGVLYGQEKLLETVSETMNRLPEPSTAVASLADEVKRYCDNVYADDITMLCISSSATGVSMNLKYDSAEIGTLISGIQLAAQREGWDDGLLNKVMLVAEEAVSNVINYSTPADPEERIEFRLSSDAATEAMTVSDSGPEFNPLVSAPDVDTDLPLEERKVGGLGIFLIRRLSEKVEYSRVDGRNILKIIIQK